MNSKIPPRARSRAPHVGQCCAAVDTREGWVSGVAGPALAAVAQYGNHWSLLAMNHGPPPGPPSQRLRPHAGT